MVTSWRTGLAVALATMVLAGCGVRSSLDLPQESKQTLAEQSKPGPDGKPVHRPFILDGLLR